MQEIVRLVSEHTLIAIAVGFAALLIVYVVFKSLIKLALILIIIAVAVGGYYYFRSPNGKPADLKGALEKARTETGQAVKKGKEAVEKGRELVGKGKEALDKGKELVDKGIEKGKDAVEKGKETAEKVGKMFGGEREDDTK